jgi:hypothetical protein
MRPFEANTMHFELEPLLHNHFPKIKAIYKTRQKAASNPYGQPIGC